MAHADGTFGNRFDDPRGQWGRPPEERFRVIYCATQRAGAFGETIARFRPSLSLLADLARIEDDQPLDPQLQRGAVPRDWRERRRLGKTVLSPELNFVDSEAAETLQHLRLALASTARSLGLADFDISAVTGPHRALTQQMAAYLYERADDLARPLFAGIRYVSRLNPRWECWAIFADRLRHTAEIPEQIQPDDAGLVEAARLFGLDIETFSGQDPWS